MAISIIGSTSGGSANGGNVTLTLPSNVANDCVIVAVAIGSSRTAVTASVTTSSGGPYTQILSSIQQSSSVTFAVWRYLVTSAALTQAVCSGTANASDSLAAAVVVFRGVSTATQTDVTPTSTIGSGTTPDSPSITPSGASGTLPLLCISVFGAGIQDTAVTSPTSFSSNVNGNATDNWPSTVCMSWITYQSFSAFDPAAWSGLTSATWAAASIFLRPDYPVGSGLMSESILAVENTLRARKIDVISY